jgi:NTE family protein
LRVALVLGGGGLKGFAHLGALRALEAHGVEPVVFAGTSIGALVAAAYVGGTPLEVLEERARSLRKADLFRIDHLGMVGRRMRNTSLYLEGPLRHLVEELVPPGTFAEWQRPLLVSTVNLEQQEQVVWGLPGLRDVPVRDAVYASCALPGFFPPAKVGEFWCVDGGVLDNVPARPATLGADVVLAVDVGSSSVTIARRVHEKGFAAIYNRAAQSMMHALQTAQLQLWDAPPLVLVRPRVWHFGWFAFGHSDAFIDAGRVAMEEALRVLPQALDAGRGVWPRQEISLTIDPARCTGCGLCAAIAPRFMRMTPAGLAEPTADHFMWSRADGDFVHQCPTDAIDLTAVTGAAHRPSVPMEIVED